jgi:hypothetical protein
MYLNNLFRQFPSVKDSLSEYTGLELVLTQLFLHKLCCLSKGFGWCFHAEGLLVSAVIVEVDPISNCSCCVLKAFEAMPLNALLFNCADYTFVYFILFWAMRAFELLFKSVVSNQTCVVATRKDKANIRAQKEGVLKLSE